MYLYVPLYQKLKNIEIRVLCFFFIRIYKLLKNLLKYSGYEGWARDEWVFFLIVFVLSCVCYVLCTSVYMCFVVTCWERADLLALVCGVFCEFVTFPLVSWVRCGT